MKTKFTFKNFFLRKEGWLTALVLAVFLFFGCYEFFKVAQPTSAYSNSSFTVPIIVKQDAEPSNDWTATDLKQFGLFGVLIPEGWTIDDKILYKIESSDSIPDGAGGWKKVEDKSNSGHLVYNALHSKMLKDSLGVPANYKWWGAKTDVEADMLYFDSLYFTVKVNTDNKVGTFYLQYAIGDVENKERQPADHVTEPIPIQISVDPALGINSFKALDFKVYPNPSSGEVNIDLAGFNSGKVQLEVLDITGKLVMKQTLDRNISTINLRDKDPGTYIVKLKYGEENKNFKILLR